ncbi:MAG: FHA domain-containing protein [Salinibacterium sp.]|nr:FHA domain-containing protein [Salinibacterium sp.]
MFCPECGFVRQRDGARSRPSDTNILDPFPWGLPRSPESGSAGKNPAVDFEPDEAPRPVVPDAPSKPFAEISDVAETRLVPRGPRGERFVLQFSTGESVSVSGSGLIGRNPVAEPGEYVDTLIAIVDPGRSVSKTHLEFGQDGPYFWVSDRYSGNGTVVREPDRDPRRCEAGKRYRVTRGARVEVGEQFFIVS